MGRVKIPDEEKRKKQNISASDLEWQRYIDAIEANGHNPSKTFRALMEGYIEGKFIPFAKQ